MDTEDYLAALTQEDVPASLKPIVSAIGADKTYKLCAVASGKRIAIPKGDAMFRKLKHVLQNIQRRH